MARQKKIKVVQQEIKPEEFMTEENNVATLEPTLDSIETEIDKARQELEATKKAIEEQKHELKRLGSREIDAAEQKIVDKQVSGFAKNAGLQAKIEKQKAYDSVMVTGKFINRRNPGKKSEKLTYMKYADDPVKWYDFEDGKIYTIPRGFADQINDYYYVPQFIQKQGEMDPNRPASAIHDIDTSNKKYGFVPLNF